MPIAANQHCLSDERGVVVDSLRGYLLTVVTAAIISGIAINLSGKKGLHGAIIKLLSGLFLSITVISPLAKIQLDNFSSYLSGIETDASAIISNAEKDANTAKTEIIKQQVETYILDEASRLGLELDVTVSFSEDTSLQPHAVCISGAISPYKKQKLQTIIQEDLGIPEEQQMWK